VAIGISQEAIASGEVGAIRVTGTSKLKLGGTVNCGSNIISHTDGTGITAADGTNERSIAIALEYGVSGDIIEVVLRSMVQTA
jgi:hypothetical protein